IECGARRYPCDGARRSAAPRGGPRTCSGHREGDSAGALRQDHAVGGAHRTAWRRTMMGDRMAQISNLRTIRAPHGSQLTAKSWLTEAPMRMLMNNLDPEVAERPGDLVVYGGMGR